MQFGLLLFLSFCLLLGSSVPSAAVTMKRSLLFVRLFFSSVVDAFI